MIGSTFQMILKDLMIKIFWGIKKKLLKELLMAKGMSVQAQTVHPVRTAIDQRGEQTINKDAKTTVNIQILLKK